MLVNERRDRLQELVRRRRFASLPELVEELDVSESTVRRDLEWLEEQGVAKRIHGGALYAGGSPGLSYFDQRQSAAWSEKKAIANTAVHLIEDGDTVMLDGGSTTYEVARLLVGRPVHVVTNSLPVANLFASDASSDLVLIGGDVCPRTGVVRGPFADKMIGSLRVRKTVFSIAGITEEGFFNNNVLLVETERTMMAAADEVIVVADSTKLGRRSLTHLCELGDVRHLVTDDGISSEWKNTIESAGVDLGIASSGMPTGESRPTIAG